MKTIEEDEVEIRALMSKLKTHDRSTFSPSMRKGDRIKNIKTGVTFDASADSFLNIDCMELIPNSYWGFPVISDHYEKL